MAGQAGTQRGEAAGWLLQLQPDKWDVDPGCAPLFGCECTPKAGSVHPLEQALGLHLWDSSGAQLSTVLPCAMEQPFLGTLGLSCSHPAIFTQPCLLGGHSGQAFLPHPCSQLGLCGGEHRLLSTQGMSRCLYRAPGWGRV